MVSLDVSGWGAAASATGPELASDGTHVTNRPPLIAVVDDDGAVCRALDRLLRAKGFEVATFVDGATFLSFVESRRPDCVVLDLQMPDMSGFDVQAQLKHAANPIPIVAITGLDTPESYQRVMEAGAAGYLRKPTGGKVLIDTVMGAIAGEHR